MRNTAIRGIQIRDGEITETQLSVSVNASLDKADSALQSIGAGSITETELNVSVNASLDLADTALQSIGAGSITETELNVSVNASLDLADTALQSLGFLGLTDNDEASYSGHAGDAVRVNAGATGIEFYTPTDVGIVAGDIAVEIVVPESAEKAYTLDTLAIESSVQVYLNGLLQEEGAGLDYVYSEAGGKSVITFDDFIETDDIVVVHSITVQA
jgi:hypothetical protein